MYGNVLVYKIQLPGMSDALKVLMRSNLTVCTEYISLSSWSHNCKYFESFSESFLIFFDDMVGKLNVQRNSIS